MKTDVLKQFVSIRRSLTNEKARIEARLQQLNGILNESDKPLTASARKLPAIKRQIANALSLKEAVQKAIASIPLTRPEILAAVQKMGYQFRSKNPLNSLSVLLYTNKSLFRKAGKKFSSAPVATGAHNGEPKKPKRKMSAAGKARIAAAQKARWAKIKAAKG